jgi:hypothetical protein
MLRRVRGQSVAYVDRRAFPNLPRVTNAPPLDLTIQMEPFSIALGVIACVDTFQKVIDTIRLARQFKKECVELGSMVALLLVITEVDSIPDANRAVVSLNHEPVPEDAIAQVKKMIEEIHELVTKCTQSLLQRGLEVLVKRKMPRLKQQLFEWITVCMMENTVSRSFFVMSIKPEF